ncbi:MAG: hypothetical protein ABH860_05725 [bacterium]
MHCVIRIAGKIRRGDSPYQTASEKMCQMVESAEIAAAEVIGKANLGSAILPLQDYFEGSRDTFWKVNALKVMAASGYHPSICFAQRFLGLPVDHKIAAQYKIWPILYQISPFGSDESLKPLLEEFQTLQPSEPFATPTLAKGEQAAKGIEKASDSKQEPSEFQKLLFALHAALEIRDACTEVLARFKRPEALPLIKDNLESTYYGRIRDGAALSALAKTSLLVPDLQAAYKRINRWAPSKEDIWKWQDSGPAEYRKAQVAILLTMAGLKKKKGSLLKLRSLWDFHLALEQTIAKKTQQKLGRSRSTAVLFKIADALIKLDDNYPLSWMEKSLMNTSREDPLFYGIIGRLAGRSQRANDLILESWDRWVDQGIFPPHDFPEWMVKIDSKIGAKAEEIKKGLGLYLHSYDNLNIWERTDVALALMKLGDACGQAYLEESLEIPLEPSTSWFPPIFSKKIRAARALVKFYYPEVEFILD